MVVFVSLAETGRKETDFCFAKIRCLCGRGEASPVFASEATRSSFPSRQVFNPELIFSNDKILCYNGEHNNLI